MSSADGARVVGVPSPLLVPRRARSQQVERPRPAALLRPWCSGCGAPVAPGVERCTYCLVPGLAAVLAGAKVLPDE